MHKVKKADLDLASALGFIAQETAIGAGTVESKRSALNMRDADSLDAEQELPQRDIDIIDDPGTGAIWDSQPCRDRGPSECPRGRHQVPPLADGRSWCPG